MLKTHLVAAPYLFSSETQHKFHQDTQSLSPGAQFPVTMEEHKIKILTVK